MDQRERLIDLPLDECRRRLEAMLERFIAERVREAGMTPAERDALQAKREAEWEAAKKRMPPETAKLLDEIADKLTAMDRKR